MKSTLYVYGVAGIGKSWLIYQLVGRLMTLQDRFRVVYVSTAANLIRNCMNILATILSSDKHLFEHKKEDYENLRDKFFNMTCNHVVVDDDDAAPDLLKDIVDLYRKIYLNFIFAIDQINNNNNSIMKQNEKKFISDCIMALARVILSATANNESDQVKIDSLSRFVPNHCFDETEFNVYRYIILCLYCCFLVIIERDIQSFIYCVCKGT